jgi:hypothetical protein
MPPVKGLGWRGFFAGGGDRPINSNLPPLLNNHRDGAIFK